MMDKWTLNPGKLTLDELRHVGIQALSISLNNECEGAINQSAKTVAELIDQGQTIYGVNTGFGLLANKQIPAEELQILQHSIVLSHAAGFGEFMSDSTVRLLMVLKVNSLARGYSGIRLSVIQALITLLNKEIYPCIPVKGSVGASGDLAPLAHMSILLLGEGEATHQGERISAKQALNLAGLEPVVLAPKEGLALLNGTQASTALALIGLFAAENVLKAATVIGAMSVDAARAAREPFDVRIHEVKGHQGQIDMATAYRVLLERSDIGASHQDCEKVQDPYSLRCQPQVMGACLQQIRQAADTILTESNSVSDNPLVFAEQGDIVSGGNFHAESIAMAADNLALAIAEIGALSERRTALLIDSKLSGLPPFLVEQGGVNSGFMMAQVTAAALASENKSLAHPACVDSLPTSANQEDHVSMATYAARRLGEMAENTVGILAVEWLAASQGLDLLKPDKTSTILEQAKAILRKQVNFYDKDRHFAPDIEKAAHLIRSGVLQSLVSAEIQISDN